MRPIENAIAPMVMALVCQSQMEMADIMKMRMPLSRLNDEVMKVDMRMDL